MSRTLIEQINDFPEVKLALGFSWALGLSIAPLAGFYFGTIAGSKHVIDLQSNDLVSGFYGAAIGLIVGVVFSLGLTIWYPRLIEREYAERANH